MRDNRALIAELRSRTRSSVLSPYDRDLLHRAAEALLRAHTAAGAAPTTPASTPIAPPPHKEKDRSA